MDVLGVLTSLVVTDWALVGAALVLLLYVVGTRNHAHFSNRNLAYIKPVPFFGSMTPVVFFRTSFAAYVQQIYNEHKDKPFFGMFQFLKPVVVVRDPELIKKITVKDFDHFVDHRVLITEDADPIFGKNLFALQGQRWRDMRTTLSPAFTSSKMKAMYAFINTCGEQIADYLDEEIKKNKNGQLYSMELKDFYTRFTNDAIATSAFGIRCDSLKEKNNEFYLMGKDLINIRWMRSIIFMGYMLSPRLMKTLRIPFISTKVANFFRFTVHDTIATREKEGIVRPDMIHLLMQARKGELKAEAEEDEEMNGQHKHAKTPLTDDDVAAQAVVFFLAGFDGASTLMCFASHLVAVHPEIQDRLQEEIDNVLGEDGKLKYESIQKLKYMDMVLAETLRMYPPGVFLDRMCVKNYKIPASDKNPEYTIKKGEIVWFPVYGLHRDPELFPEPDRFNPERFSDENKNHIHPFSYMPFGAGPRICIGQRFALLESKVALAHVLSRFSLRVVDKTPIPIKLTKKGFNVTVDGGFWLGVEPRNV